MSESSEVDWRITKAVQAMECECRYPNDPTLAYSCCPVHGYKGNDMQDGIAGKKENTTMTTENTAVAGEETLDTTTLEVKEIPLIKKGKYTATMNGFTKHVGKEWNSVPNVSVGHKLTSNKRVVFGTLLLSTAPDKNGNLHIQRTNGAKALLKVLGTDIQGWKIHKEMRTNPEGSQVEVKWLDPDQLIAALEQYKGSVTYQVNVTEQPANNGYPAKNDIFSFAPAE